MTKKANGRWWLAGLLLGVLGCIAGELYHQSKSAFESTQNIVTVAQAAASGEVALMLTTTDGEIAHSGEQIAIMLTTTDGVAPT